MQPSGEIMQSGGRCGAEIVSTAVPPDKSAGVEEQVHACSMIGREFLDRRIKICGGLHGAGMKRGDTTGGSGEFDCAGGSLVDAVARPFAHGLIYHPSGFLDEAGSFIIQIDGQNVHGEAVHLCLRVSNRSFTRDLSLGSSVVFISNTMIPLVWQSR